MHQDYSPGYVFFGYPAGNDGRFGALTVDSVNAPPGWSGNLLREPLLKTASLSRHGGQGEQRWFKTSQPEQDCHLFFFFLLLDSAEDRQLVGLRV